MGFTLQDAYTAPAKKTLPLKNRVGEKFETYQENIDKKSCLAQYPCRENHLTPTKLASGRTRWLSRDPIAENGGINLYGYVKNSPINFWDPNGLEPLPSYNPYNDPQFKDVRDNPRHPRYPEFARLNNAQLRAMADLRGIEPANDLEKGLFVVCITTPTPAAVAAGVGVVVVPKLAHCSCNESGSDSCSDCGSTRCCR